MRKASAFVFAAVIIVLSGLVYTAAVVNPVVADYARAVLEKYTVDAVNNALASAVEIDTYNDLTDIRRTASGTITSINVNMVLANKTAGGIAKSSQANLDTMTDGGIPIPIGTFSGVPLLVGRGKPIMLQIKPLGAVNCRFDSSFTSGGINQTRHRVLLYADTTVNVVLPLFSKRTEVSIMMLFSESIIIGEVPQYIIP
jgi:sporulation protein YunB